MNEDKWMISFTALTGQRITDEEGAIWFQEILKAFPEWELAKESEFNDIKADIKESIRYQFTQKSGKISRADDERKVSKYGVADLIMWIREYHKTKWDRKKEFSPSETDERIIRALKPVIQTLCERRDYDTAAKVCFWTMECPESQNAMFEAHLGNISLTREGEDTLCSWCIVECGFDPKSQLIDWSKRFRKAHPELLEGFKPLKEARCGF